MCVARKCACVHAGAMLSRTCVEKKRSGARADGRARAGGDIFLRATRECRERHAFDWPRVVGSTAGEQGARMRGEGGSAGAEEVAEGGAGGPPFTVDFSGLFFYGRRPSLAWMNEHGEEHQ